MFDPARRERAIRLEDDWSFVIGASGIPADKTGDARERFNQLPLAVAAILDLWNRSAKRSDATLLAAATDVPDARERIRNLLRVLPVPGFSPNILIGRLEQFLEESLEIIPQGRRSAGQKGRSSSPDRWWIAPRSWPRRSSRIRFPRR